MHCFSASKLSASHPLHPEESPSLPSCTSLYPAAKSLQSFLTLCDPVNGSPPGSPIPGILQARTLEWVAISFSSAWKWKVKVKSLSRVQLFTTPWTAAYQAPPPMGFSRQEYWNGVLFLNPPWNSLWSLQVYSVSFPPLNTSFMPLVGYKSFPVYNYTCT